jgi:hypothetical protein
VGENGSKSKGAKHTESIGERGAIGVISMGAGDGIQNPRIEIVISHTEFTERSSAWIAE